MDKIVQYEHKHQDGGTTVVFVREDLIGQHRQHCLCYRCAGLVKPSKDAEGGVGPIKKRNRCRAANRLYKLVRQFGMVAPVFECPNFQDVAVTQNFFQIKTLDKPGENLPELK